MAQMFSEGLEAAPLLLDDPFGFWDDGRIERMLPIGNRLRATARNFEYAPRAKRSPSQRRVADAVIHTAFALLASPAPCDGYV